MHKFSRRNYQFSNDVRFLKGRASIEGALHFVQRYHQEMFRVVQPPRVHDSRNIFSKFFKGIFGLILGDLFEQLGGAILELGE